MAVKQVIAVAALFLVATAASAQVATGGELADLQARRIMAEARAKLARAEADAGEARGVASQDGTPTVSGIGGSVGNLYVTFFGAGHVPYRPGMTTPGGYVVRSVALNEVRLAKDGKVTILHLSDSAPVKEERKDSTLGAGVTPPVTVNPFVTPPTQLPRSGGPT